MAVCFIRDHFDAGYASLLLFKLAIHLLNGLLFDLYIVYFTQLGTLIICVSTTLLQLGLIKLQQTNRLLASSKPRLSSTTFHRFRAAHLGTITYSASSLRYYGRIFTAFLAVNFPLSVWMLVFNVVNLGGDDDDKNVKRQSASSKVFTGNLLFLQCFIIFAVHIAMAQWPRLIHKPAKVLLGMMASHRHYQHQQHQSTSCKSTATNQSDGNGGSKKNRRQHLRLLLQVEHLIDALHRKNLYTLNYGSLGGSITTRTFGLFLLYYAKLLMICFKMLRSR